MLHLVAWPEGALSCNGSSPPRLCRVSCARMCRPYIIRRVSLPLPPKKAKKNRWKQKKNYPSSPQRLETKGETQFSADRVSPKCSSGSSSRGHGAVIFYCCASVQREPSSRVMPADTLSNDDLTRLYTWVDEIELSRPKRNIARDFSDGVLVAEVR